MSNHATYSTSTWIAKRKVDGFMMLTNTVHSTHGNFGLTPRTTRSGLLSPESP